MTFQLISYSMDRPIKMLTRAFYPQKRIALKPFALLPKWKDFTGIMSVVDYTL